MKKLLTVMGGAILMFGLAFTASAQAAPAVTNVAIETSGNNYVLSVTASGFTIENGETTDGVDGLVFDFEPEITFGSETKTSLSLCLGENTKTEAYTNVEDAYCIADLKQALTDMGVTLDLEAGSEAETFIWKITFGETFLGANKGKMFTANNFRLFYGTDPDDNDNTVADSNWTGGEVFQLIPVDVGINVTPAAGTIYLDAGQDFVLTVQATGADAGLVTALEVDHSMQSTIPEFTVYASTDNPYGINNSGEIKNFIIGGVNVSVASGESEKTLYETLGVNVVYANNTWTLTFESGKPVFEAIKNNHGITFYLVLKDEADLFGSMFDVTEDITFAYTFEENATDVLSLSGFSNQTIRVGDSKTLNGALNLSNYGGTKVTGEQTLSLTSGDVDGIEVSTSTPNGGTMNPLGVPLGFDFECEGPCGDDNELEAGASASIPLDITVKALKQGTYTFNYTAVVGSDTMVNETFTITVNRKSTGSSGGGGGSRPSQNVDTSTTVSGDILVIDGKSYDLKNLNAQEETVVKGYFLKTIIALLQQIIALKMTQG